MKTVLKVLRGFGYAFEGIWAAIKSETNMKIHVFALVCVVIAGFLLHISNTEWMAVALCCALVIGAEMMNTAIEKLVDVVDKTKRPELKFIKDVAAGGVLVCAIGAACVGLLIFIPKIVALF